MKKFFSSSLKTEENLCAITTIPSDRLVIETDCPWCEIRQTHDSFKDVVTRFPSVKKEKWQPDRLVKGRNEPCTIVLVYIYIFFCSQSRNSNKHLHRIDRIINAFYLFIYYFLQLQTNFGSVGEYQGRGRGISL